ncbi:MAG: EscU/YscU/HrcU family type III secretion system export apparatus switch protein, partial [Roseobacter sp.]|nr:EscU/YscU/HrcU family type III secretion system export apparatus switch protein [Roseobacter sp.]
MSAQDDDQNDKSFEPTPQKLLEARKKGEIARSLEMLTAASYFGFFVSLSIFGFSHLTQLTGLMTVVIDQSAQLAPLFFEGGAAAPTQGILRSIAWAVLPFFCLPASAVLVVLFATRGIVFAPVKIQPKLSKISVIANAKNKFGRNGLFQFSLSFVKLNVYSICLIAFLHFRLDQLVAAIRFSPQNIVSLLATICVEFLMIVVVVSAIIGGTDAIWQHFEHIRK